jgi:hypothetical protein
MPGLVFDELRVFILHIFPVLFCVPLPIFFQGLDWEEEVDMRIRDAALLSESWMEKPTIMSRLTNSSKNCIARARFSFRENSFCKAMSKLYTSWVWGDALPFLRRSRGSSGQRIPVERGLAT